MNEATRHLVRWRTLATSRKVIYRSLKVSLLVGSILVLINQLDVFLSGQLALSNYIQMLLTYCVPYCVSTYASVDTMMNLENTVN